MNSTLLEHTIITRAQCVQVLEGLERLKGEVHTNNNQWHETLGSLFSVDQKKALIEALSITDPATMDRGKLYTDISEIIKQLENLPQVGLTLAYSPSEAALIKWSLWFIKEYGRKVIFYITVNPSLIGGATISFQGKYKDFSLDRTIRTYLANHTI
jgi:hypothetical protein